jgi:hypothetical protein
VRVLMVVAVRDGRRLPRKLAMIDEGFVED